MTLLHSPNIDQMTETEVFWPAQILILEVLRLDFAGEEYSNAAYFVTSSRKMLALET